MLNRNYQLKFKLKNRNKTYVGDAAENPMRTSEAKRRIFIFFEISSKCCKVKLIPKNMFLMKTDFSFIAFNKRQMLRVSAPNRRRLK